MNLVELLKAHGEYHDDKCFKQLTTLKMGGPIKHLVYPNSIEDCKIIVNYLRESFTSFKVIGNGSNLVCGESEFDGVVVCLKKIDKYTIHDNQAYVEAGVMAPLFAGVLAKEGLSGMEFASSIPGDIGGLLYMNAGAYNKSMSDVVTEVLVLKNNELVWMNVEECEYGYRTSVFQKHPRWVILACKMALAKKDPDEIHELMNDRLIRRQNTQPLDKHSAGSCFRNPEGLFAWKLIDELGMRGYERNGVKVSEKHPNFLVNEGEGTATDYLGIALEIQDKVFEEYNVKLIMEVEKFNC